jgi:hypothetical protein
MSFRSDAGSSSALAYLNTTLWGEKVAPTPSDYRYEL